jgi:hypothetical protein
MQSIHGDMTPPVIYSVFEIHCGPLRARPPIYYLQTDEIVEVVTKGPLSGSLKFGEILTFSY